MNCPSCRGAMEALALSSRLDTPIEIDACWSCQVIWFDHMESTSLSPASVIDLFKRIHAARGESRNLVSMRTACPRCSAGLSLTHDLGRGGQFSYNRCPNGDGRLISFTQFLLEKSFVRTLNPAEVMSLAVKVKQIRCSSCGAPVNLEKDTACTHCGAPISVLDEQAVEKALKEYDARAQQRPAAAPYQPVPTRPSPSQYTPDPVLGGWALGDLINTVDTGGTLVDLIGDGISSLFD